MKNTYLTKVYKKPKWYWFLPLIGFFLYFKNINDHKEEFQNDPEFKVLKKIESKFLKSINILVILLFIINIFVTNLGWFIWRKLIKKAGWTL